MEQPTARYSSAAATNGVVASTSKYAADATPRASRPRVDMSGHTVAREGGSPRTPPRGLNDLPTPPTSHIELSVTTAPPQDREQRRTSDDEAESPAGDEAGRTGGVSQSGAHRAVDHSPSVVAHHRRANRVSMGSQSQSQSHTAAEGEGSSYSRERTARIVGDAPGPSSAPIEEGSATREEQQRGRSRSRQRHVDAGADADLNDEDGSVRSRTPSPILGSIVSSRGHLSFGAALQPSPEEVQMLLYGSDGKDEERPVDVSKEDIDTLQQRLEAMGLANPPAGVSPSREAELAAMVKKVLQHSQQQDHYIDSLEASLHNTRLRSISTLSSLRTSFAHSFAAEYELRARLEAELEDVRTQARKLSSMLIRSESRNEEADRERAMSAEEEVMWQEEMKDHASAYAQQQAAKARAAQRAQSHGSKQHSGQTLDTAIDSSAAARSPAQLLDEPFEEKKASSSSKAIEALPKSNSEGNIMGLGISSPSGPTADARANAMSSPLSTIIKERNKLLADKRYLKARTRDAEAQRDRLELELKSLRPLLVQGALSKKEAASQLASTPSIGAQATPSRSQKRDRSRRRRQAVLGDAEAEHLLLAARRLSNRPKEEGARPHTPPPMSSASHLRTPKTPRTVQAPRSAAVLDSVTQSSTSTRMADSDGFPPAPASPLAARNDGELGRWGTHQRIDSNRSTGGIDDLLQAAQTVLSPSSRHKQASHRVRDGVLDSDQDEDVIQRSPARGPPASVSRFTAASVDASPKRRRVSSAALEPASQLSNGLPLSPDKSVFANARRMRTQTDGAEPYSSQEQIPSASGNGPMASQTSALSALDLLADQAAQSQQPSQSSELSGSGEGEPYMGPHSEESDDGMVVDDHGAPQHLHAGPSNGHFYPRGAYGHAYAHPPPISTTALGHDGYRMMAAGQSGPYGYGPSNSPVSLSSQGWTSQAIPANRNGLYSPPSGHPRFALQSGPRITTGHVAAMGGPAAPGTMPPMVGGTPRFSKSSDGRHGSAGSAASDESESGGGGGGGGGGGAPNRTPQKGGNTSPDKRLPYVRWSEEEDTKLRSAIDEYGQRWELVARAVGTRSYHQCRQRYLLMRRKDAAAREGAALSAAAGNGKSHSLARNAAVTSPTR